MRVSVQNGDSFSVKPNETLLDAAQSAGIGIAYSCKLGRCSTCKVKILSGKTSALAQEEGLTQQEKAEGWILSCVRNAQQDLKILVDDLLPFPLPQAQTLPCKISQIQRLTNEIIHVRLRLPPKAQLIALAGQYIDVIIPGGERRSYSLASLIRNDNTFDLHIQAVPDGVLSHYWFTTATEGSLLRITGPLGSFFLRPNTKGRNIAFLATGTGIAPIKAILEAVSNTAWKDDMRPNSLTVYWGVRNQNDLYWPGLECASIAGVPFHFIPVLSCPSSGWTGRTGHVQAALLDDTPDLTLLDVYACGSQNMIIDAMDLLSSAGLDLKNFYSDPFVDSSSN